MRSSSFLMAFVPATILASPLAGVTSLPTSPTTKATVTSSTPSIGAGIVSKISSAVAQFTGTCSAVVPAVYVLQAWGTPASSFCTSWIPITTVTAPTVTVTAPVSTITAVTSTVVVVAAPTTTTLSQQTITVATSTSYLTVYTSTAIITGPATCDANQAHKRAASSPTYTFPSNVPLTLKTFASSYISSACQCLHLPTPTFTPTTITTPLTTYTPLTTTITTPVVTETPVSATYTPSTTVTVQAVSTVTVLGVPTGVILPNPTPIITGAQAADDSHFSISLPFPITLYGQTAIEIQISVNGWISLSGVDQQNAHNDFDQNHPLPSNQVVATAILPYWYDLVVLGGTQQGLFYSVYGDAGRRRVAFEWYTTDFNYDYVQRAKVQGGREHFIVTVQEEAPGRVTYDYYELAPRPLSYTGGSRAGTVGVQRNSQGKAAQYSYNGDVPVTAGTRLVYDPLSDSFSSGPLTSCFV